MVIGRARYFITDDDSLGAVAIRTSMERSCYQDQYRAFSGQPLVLCRGYYGSLLHIRSYRNLLNTFFGPALLIVGCKKLANCLALFAMSHLANRKVALPKLG